MLNGSHVTRYRAELVLDAYSDSCNTRPIWYGTKGTIKQTKKLNSVALVRKRTIPTERPPFVGEVSANFGG
jgi:hypothetical protein